MNIQDAEYYRRLITSQYRGAARFNAMVTALVNYGVGLDIAVKRLNELFDIDTATTNQLDILGAIVGVSRTLDFEPSPQAAAEIICPTPTELAVDNVADSLYTVYQTPAPAKLAGTNTVIIGFTAAEMNDAPLITDDIYRTLVKARIIQNIWKGDAASLYSMWATLFPETKKIIIGDRQDMSFDVVLYGEYTLLELELVLHGYILPKPEGVRINTLSYTDLSGLPIFSYDYNTLQMSGYKSHWQEHLK